MTPIGDYPDRRGLPIGCVTPATGNPQPATALEAQLAALRHEAAQLRDLALALADLAQQHLRTDSPAYLRIDELCAELRKDAS